jgi:lycopene cyclase domain-containing protein
VIDLMSYLTFLFYFVIVPTLVLMLGLVIGSRRNDRAFPFLWRHWQGAAILALIAIVWTTPWDNAIISHGVWSYGKDRVIGTIWSVPLEEYAFMILMPFLNAAFIAWLMGGVTIASTRHRSPQRFARWIVLSAAAAVFLTGLMLLCIGPGVYLGAILVWFAPPIALQIIFDPSTLGHHWRVVAAGTIFPALYLSAADAYAIRAGIWTIMPETRTGLEIGGLPIEEALFFFTVSLLIAQGLVLWHSLFNKDKS